MLFNKVKEFKQQSNNGIWHELDFSNAEPTSTPSTLGRNVLQQGFPFAILKWLIVTRWTTSRAWSLSWMLSQCGSSSWKPGLCQNWFQPSATSCCGTAVSCVWTIFIQFHTKFEGAINHEMTISFLPWGSKKGAANAKQRHVNLVTEQRTAKTQPPPNLLKALLPHLLPPQHLFLRAFAKSPSLPAVSTNLA